MVDPPHSTNADLGQQQRLDGEANRANNVRATNISNGVFFAPIGTPQIPYDDCPPIKENRDQALLPSSVRLAVSPAPGPNTDSLRIKVTTALAQAAPRFPGGKLLFSSNGRRTFLDVICSSQEHADELGCIQPWIETITTNGRAVVYTISCLGVGRPYPAGTIGVELLPVAKPGKSLPADLPTDTYQAALLQLLARMYGKTSRSNPSDSNSSSTGPATGLSPEGLFSTHVLGFWRETAWLCRDGVTEHQPLLAARAAVRIPPPPFLTSHIEAWALCPSQNYDFRVNFIGRAPICGHCRVAVHAPLEICPRIVCRRCHHEGHHENACGRGKSSSTVAPRGRGGSNLAPPSSGRGSKDGPEKPPSKKRKHSSERAGPSNLPTEPRLRIRSLPPRPPGPSPADDMES
ncbi:hypothetical protein FA10DRAFT_285602 [Acaromyces ingoldii]|uniref:Uncharacterized protein n=1 Tax=Acaromyces ingoldii TaxID=215250 RepID=A0A316YM53_9BASI|nr:hypothetical protein FA10DRAFT_285602 [Acaromyces ingoldii]PWN89884.1 hypothetical protein FA10DRAFT_285602 [Acaromyces ingoldii]